MNKEPTYAYRDNSIDSYVESGESEWEDGGHRDNQKGSVRAMNPPGNLEKSQNQSSCLRDTDDETMNQEGETRSKMWSDSNPDCECKAKFGCCDLLPEKVRKKLQALQRWFLDDLSSTHLIWIKLIFFFQSASLVVLYPYLVIHMRSLGLSVEEVAMVNGVIPAADIVGPPMAGFIADKIGNFKLFMSGLTLLSGASSLLLLLIPSKTILTSLSPQDLTCCQSSESQDMICWDPSHSYLAEYSGYEASVEQSHLSCHTAQGRNVVLSSVVQGSSAQNSRGGSNCTKFTLCEGMVEQVREDWELSFGCYIALRAVIDVLRASSCMMFEGAVVVTIKQLGGDYGLQKLFGTLGAIIWGPISGQIIDMASSASGRENYAPVFYAFFVLRIMCAILILKLNLSFKQPAKKMFKNLGKLIIKPHIMIFLLMFFLCGAIWGFLESYLFWFLEDLGSTKLTMGISLTVGTLAGIPLTVASGVVIRKLGNANVIVMALLIYSLRLLGYSFINTPTESLFFEVFKPFGNSLLMIAAMTYAKNNADINTMASLEGVMGALYFGVGKALGSLVGGLAIDKIGLRTTFRCFSALSMGAASIYWLFIMLFDKRRMVGDDNNEKKDTAKAVDEEDVRENKTHDAVYGQEDDDNTSRGT